MQVLIRFDVTDPDAFRTAYEQATERRDRAGLTQLQLWREEGRGCIWGLYEASDRSQVDEWLSTETALRDQITGTEAHFLRTV